MGNGGGWGWGVEMMVKEEMVMVGKGELVEIRLPR
jgi:hypothetical protein